MIRVIAVAVHETDGMEVGLKVIPGGKGDSQEEPVTSVD